MLILLCRQKMIMHSQPSLLPKGVFDFDLMFLTPYSDCATLHREHRKLSYWCPSLSLKAICHPELSTSLRWIPLNVCVSLWSSHDDVRWSNLASNGASGYRTSWTSFANTFRKEDTITLPMQDSRLFIWRVVGSTLSVEAGQRYHYCETRSPLQAHR